MSDETEMDEEETGRRRRGIFILPNLFTTAAMFAGFYAVVAAMGGRFVAASVAIFVAMVMDGLDGRVARMTGTESDFGKEYDSLSDMVSFGLAPALVMYQWAFHQADNLTWTWAKLGWLAAFFYAVTAALRLARFNTRVGVQDKRYFQGLPSPSAAGLIAGLVWLGTEQGFHPALSQSLGFIVAVGTGLLMFSNISYYSFKDINLGKRIPFAWVLVIPLIFVLIAAAPPKVLFTLFFLFAISGPVLSLLRWFRRRSRGGSGGDDEPDEGD